VVPRWYAPRWQRWRTCPTSASLNQVWCHHHLIAPTLGKRSQPNRQRHPCTMACMQMQAPNLRTSWGMRLSRAAPLPPRLRTGSNSVCRLYPSVSGYRPCIRICIRGTVWSSGRHPDIRIQTHPGANLAPNSASTTSAASAAFTPSDALRGRRGVGEFMRRAFDNGRMDLTQIEGVADLLAADTAAQHRLAVRQTGGALRDTLEGCDHSHPCARSRHDVLWVRVSASSR